MKKLFSIFLISIFFIPSLSLASIKENHPKMWKVFSEIGLEFPNEWESWSKNERGKYLMNLGIYPQYGNHYNGEAGDLSKYFKTLGIEKPKNWDSLSFEERNKIVMNSPFFSVQNKNNSINKVENPETEENNEEKINTEYEYNEILELIQNKNFPILITIFCITFAVLGFLLFQKKSWRKLLQYSSYYAIPFLLLTTSILIPEKFIFNNFGSLSEILLIAILFIKPLAVIFSSSLLMKILGLRKELGIITFWFFLFHGAGLIYIYELLQIENLEDPVIFWGFIAGIGMTILGLTSNKFSIKLLKKNWKKLQYLAYPVLFATLLHSGLAEHDGIEGYLKAIIIGGIFIVLKVLEWRKIKINI